MEIIKTPFDGVLLLKPKIFSDERGCFQETWQQRRFSDIGISYTFVQDNESISKKGVLRGLHFQKQHPQGKLVRVSVGEVFDVVVDIRRDSPTFGQWFGTVLSQENRYQLWVPPGLAHGFIVLSEIAYFHYKCTDFYYPNDEGTIRWNDPKIGIKWPYEGEPILSVKDASAPFFEEIVSSIGN